MKQLLYAVIVASAFLSLSGCAVTRNTAVLPEARPLGKDIPTLSVKESLKPPTPIAEPTGTLTLQQALGLALMHNPELAVYSMEIRAREAQALQESLLPNPEVDIESENFGGSGALGGFRSAETTLSIGQLIELAGKREKRTRIAVLESDLAAWEYEAKRLDVFTDVVSAFTEVLAAQQRVTLETELIELARAFLTTIRKRVDAGKDSPAEATRAEVELFNAQIALERARRELFAARQRLAATWGSSEPKFETVTGTLDTVFPLPALEKLAERIEQNPDLARQAVILEQRKAVIELARAGRIPDPTISGGLRYLNDSGDNAFVLGVSLPLPVFNRNQGFIQEARYRKAQAQWQREAVNVAVRSRLGELYNRLSAVNNEIDMIRNKSLPGAQKAFQVIQEGFLLGRFGFLDVLDAQRTLFEIRSRYLDALVEYHSLTARLERLIGQSLNQLK